MMFRKPQPLLAQWFVCLGVIMTTSHWNGQLASHIKGDFAWLKRLSLRAESGRLNLYIHLRPNIRHRETDYPEELKRFKEERNLAFLTTKP